MTKGDEPFALLPPGRSCGSGCSALTQTLHTTTNADLTTHIHTHMHTNTQFTLRGWSKVHAGSERANDGFGSGFQRNHQTARKMLWLLLWPTQTTFN